MKLAAREKKPYFLALIVGTNLKQIFEFSKYIVL
jgi:hypothetical protein